MAALAYSHASISAPNHSLPAPGTTILKCSDTLIGRTRAHAFISVQSFPCQSSMRQIKPTLKIFKCCADDYDCRLTKRNKQTAVFHDMAPHFIRVESVEPCRALLLLGMQYSRGQSKSTNRLSQREVNVTTRFWQILAPNFKRSPPKVDFSGWKYQMM